MLTALYNSHSCEKVYIIITYPFEVLLYCIVGVTILRVSYSKNIPVKKRDGI